MQLKFIGTSGVVDGQHIEAGRTYDVEIVRQYKRRGFWVCIDGHALCPYTNLEAFLKNWEKICKNG